MKKKEQRNSQWAEGGRITYKNKAFIGIYILNFATFNILGKVFLLGLIKTETNYE